MGLFGEIAKGVFNAMVDANNKVNAVRDASSGMDRNEMARAFQEAKRNNDPYGAMGIARAYKDKYKK